MTRIVVYDPEDHEPITVVEIPREFMREVEDGRRNDIRLLFRPEPRDFTNIGSVPADVHPMKPSYTRLMFERISWGPDRPTMWVLHPTGSMEDTLRLRSVFLPGQMPEVQRREREAEFRMLLKVLGADE